MDRLIKIVIFEDMSMSKVRVGILMGGPSREREISFAGGRTVYDNLDKSLYEGIPLFMDSIGMIIRLDWENVYKGSIRDFYPPVSYVPDSPNQFQIYDDSLQSSAEERIAMGNQVGTVVALEKLSEHVDLIFTTLHGGYGEDGVLQGVLRHADIPFTGSDILPSAIGISKAVQKKWMEKAGMDVPAYHTISRQEWLAQPEEHITKILNAYGDRFVVRPSHQGSSIGVQILKKPSREDVAFALNKAFFRKKLTKSDWQEKSAEEQLLWIRTETDIKEGLGFPLRIAGEAIYHPEVLLEQLNAWSFPSSSILLEAIESESTVVIESFLSGREFSCIVLNDPNGRPIALPPTEIIKKSAVYDYRSKYLPGLSQKKTPIAGDSDFVKRIQSKCIELFDFFEFNCYARIDGFIEDDGTIYLNDPNTTSGMLPSSFFFHQAAEIGLSPGQFIHYIIYRSLQERELQRTKLVQHSVFNTLEHAMQSATQQKSSQQNIGVILGGYSFERHISVESGRNIFEKLSAHAAYHPIPIFLKKEKDGFSLYELPINLLLKDNADDIANSIDTYNASPDDYTHPIIEEIRSSSVDIIDLFPQGLATLTPRAISFPELKTIVDGVFIALHGRPGEDGTLQQMLEQYNIPYNGSAPSSASTTIDKYKTLSILRSHGFKTANQKLYTVEHDSLHQIAQDIVGDFTFPFIMKPVDDGCSSAVTIINTDKKLNAYLRAISRHDADIALEDLSTLGLAVEDEFPIKSSVLVESLITREDADHFLEITGGLLTQYDENGKIVYNMLEPSEALSSGEILSLEEKFLAGQGQNITPARYDANPLHQKLYSDQVKSHLQRAAEILQVQGYARIDAFVRIYHKEQRAETIVIEVNSLPGMTPATCIFHQAALDELKPDQFIDNILRFSFDRAKHISVPHE